MRVPRCPFTSVEAGKATWRHSGNGAEIAPEFEQMILLRPKQLLRDDAGNPPTNVAAADGGSVAAMSIAFWAPKPKRNVGI